MGKEFGRWRYAKTSTAGLQAVRKRRGRGLQTPSSPRAMLNKLHKTDRKAKALKKLGIFHSTLQNHRKHCIRKKKSPLQLKRWYNMIHDIYGIHKGDRSQPFKLKVTSQILKLHRQRPDTSLEAGCNTHGTRGQPSVRQPDHTVNSPTKLTLCQETVWSETCSF